MNSLNPKLQRKYPESAIKNKLKDLLSELKGIKLVITQILKFKKIQNDDKTLYSTFYLNSKAETIIRKIFSTVISNIQNSLGQGSGWIFDSVIDDNSNISKYNPLAGSSYIKLYQKN